jgi:hypothetical protein
MPKLFGNSAIRDFHYKKLLSKLMELSDDIKNCEHSELSLKNKKKLRVAQRQLDSAFNNLVEVRG